MLSVAVTRIVHIVIAVILLFLALAAFISVFNWNNSDIYSIIVAVLAIICLCLGIFGGIKMHKLALLVYTVFCGVFVVLNIIGVVTAAFVPDWYSMSVYIVTALFWFVAAFFSFTLWKSSS